MLSGVHMRDQNDQLICYYLIGMLHNWFYEYNGIELMFV